MKRIFLLAMALAVAGSAFAFDVKTDAKQEYPTFKINGWLKVTYMDTLYHDTLVTYPSGFEAKDAAIKERGELAEARGGLEVKATELSKRLAAEVEARDSAIKKSSD
ncbi:MAG: hypothetical protein Q8O74_09285, partial [bacterium]|nr:hypothetical protein [bacterium]